MLGGGTLGLVLDENGNMVGSELGGLGNFYAGAGMSPGVAWTLERSIANLRPYRGNTYNVPRCYFHSKNLPAAGTTSPITFFDGTIATAGLMEAQTNFPGAQGLPSDSAFALRAIAVDIEPLLNIESNPPAWASTALQLLATNSPAINAENLERLLKICQYTLTFGNKEIINGVGLQRLSARGGSRVGGVHANTTASTIASSLRRSNDGGDVWGFEIPVPLGIRPGDRITLRIRPLAVVTFLDHSAAASISTMTAMMFGDHVQDR